ncbi:hypothetical protein TWF506_010139 [Arthrobotrys conoides]|uniref:Uncharacterized protein n=1 Tax=Arthrobotrys conoides TaxID=74498 RepID=A0AAN8NMI4_9PEZI
MIQTTSVESFYVQRYHKDRLFKPTDITTNLRTRYPLQSSRISTGLPILSQVLLFYKTALLVPLPYNNPSNLAADQRLALQWQNTNTAVKITEPSQISKILFTKFPPVLVTSPFP